MKADFAPVLALLRERAGLVFSTGRRDAVLASIRRAMRRTGAPDPARYAELLAADGAALEALLAEVTVGETYFFRDTGQWELVRSRILPEIAARRGRVRAWSAACATGEEPYTLAIVCRELGMADRCDIVATDVSVPRLEAARAGVYSRWSLRGVPEEVVREHFTPVEKRWALDPAIRARVEFRPLNLAAEGFPGEMDLVLCRNALIYLDGDAIPGVARRLFDSLAEGGWLLLGASDPPLSDFVECEVVVTDAGLAFRRRPPTLRLSVSTGAVTARVPALPPLPVRHAPGPRPRDVPDIHPRQAPRAATSARGAPDPAEARRRYAARDYAGAEAAAREAVARGEGDADAWIVRVRALANRGRAQEAEAACAGALERHRGVAELHYLHAMLLSQAGRDREAAAAVRQALYLDPALAPAHLLAAAAAQRRGNADAARRSLRNAERVLAELPADAPVPGSDGEPAGRMLSAARAQLGLLSRGAA